MLLWIYRHFQELDLFMRGSRKLCQRGSNFGKGFFFFFFFLEGRDDPSKYHKERASIGPPAKRHFKWHFTGVRIIAQNNADYVALSGPVLQRNPIFLWFSRGGGPDPQYPPPPHTHLSRSAYAV